MAYQSVKIGLAVLGLGLIGLGQTARASEPERRDNLIWPLTNEPSLSSSFGEFREGHLHAGIDIRTSGRDGVPCQAVADGYIFRIRASNFGYGKALYLRLVNGETAVYAHLSEFSPRLETFLFKEQQRRNSYEVDLQLRPGRFQFKAGEILGYTGSTGGVAPHLHFEIRDDGEHPMNPLTNGFPLPDRTPPHFDKIVWIPRDRAARLDGSPFPRELKVHKKSAGRYVCRDTVVLDGSWGIAARIYDRRGNSSGRLAPYRIDLFADGRQLARLDLERFSFPQAGQLELIYDMERALASNLHYFTLFRREGETVWNRWFENGGLIIADSLSPGGNPDRHIHQVELQAADPAGNLSRLSIPVRLDGPGAARNRQPGRYRPLHPGAAANLFIFDDVVCLEEDFLSEETAARLGAAGRFLGLDSGTAAGSARRSFALTARDLGSQPVVMLRPAHSQNIYLVPVLAARAGLRQFPELSASLHYAGETFYGDGFVYIKAAGLAGDDLPDPGELIPLLPELYLGPPSLALRSPLELSFPAPDTARGRPAVYRLNEKKSSWDYQPTGLKGDSIRAGVRNAGVYKVFADSTRPRIGVPRLVRHRMYADGRTCPEIVIPVEDAGSGVDGVNSKVLLGGKGQIVRWDGPSKKLFVLLPDPNIIGLARVMTSSGADDSGERREPAAQSPVYTLKVIAVDRVGNKVVLDTSLSIPEEYFSLSPERNSQDVE